MLFEDIPEFYRRRLPHRQPIGGTFFVTFRLHGSIPPARLTALKFQYDLLHQNVLRSQIPDKREQIDRLHKRFFRDYDLLMDQAPSDSPRFLSDPEVRNLVKEQLHRFDGELYDLICYCIMPNHVHLLIDTRVQIPEDIHPVNWEGYDFAPLSVIMNRIKGASAYYANRLLKRTGLPFWQHENYDRVPRPNGEMGRIIDYILLNPVRAGLVQDWRDYAGNYYCMS